MEPLSLTIALFLVICALVYYYATRNFNYWKDRGVKFIKPYPLVGSLYSTLTLKEHMNDFCKRMVAKYKGKEYVGFFQASTPALLVLDPEIIKNIFVKDFSSFTDHAFRLHEEVDPLNSKNLFNLIGQRWKEMRNKLSPTFTSGKIKGMFPLVEDCSKMLGNHVKEHQQENIDVKDLLARYTTDVIGSCVFGINSNSIQNPEDQFRVMGKKILDIDIVQGIKNAFIIFLPKVACLLNLKFIDINIETFFRKLVNDIIAKREKSGNTRKDFMQLMIQLKERGRLVSEEGEAAENHSDLAHSDENKITEDDIVGQSLGFYFAGFETSSSTLTLAMMELARAPLIQQKAREDIEQVLERHNGVLSFQALQDMTYLDLIIQETLRMYPIVSFMTRECTKKYKLPNTDITIDKGTVIYYPNGALQNDPQFYSNPATFDPSRFENEEEVRRNQFVNVPFGEGPRQCIGMRFAKMKTKLAVYAILRNYEVLESPMSVYPPVWDPKQFGLSPLDKIFVQFKALNQ